MAVSNSRPVPSSGDEMIARVLNGAAMALSYAVNPLVLPPVVYGLVLVHIGASPADVSVGIGIAGAFLGIVPLAHVGWMRLRGAVDSLEIRDRSKRVEPFLGVLGATLVALLLVWSLDVTGWSLLVALLGCHLLNTSLLFGITVRWKISVHCSSVAGALSTLTYVRVHVAGNLLSSTGGDCVLGSGMVLVLLMLWARVYTGAHTVLQAVVGMTMGLIFPYAELYMFGVGPTV